MKPEETFDFPIRWAWHKISRLYNLEAHKHGFTMSIGYALLNIDKNEGTPSTKLGPLMGMEARSLTRTLKTMEAYNFIERKPDKNDKRMVRVFLTDKGLEARSVARNTVIQFNESIQDILSIEEQKSFFDIMTKVNKSLDESELFENKPVEQNIKK